MNVVKKRTVNDLIGLAKLIKDKGLRRKTVDFLSDPKITNPSIKYDATNLGEMPSWIGAHHYYVGGLVDHIYSVTMLCITMSDSLDSVYKEKIKRDELIAAALLHDICKVFQLSKNEDGFEFTNHLLDHCLWVCNELYARGFPEDVIAIVAAHGGESMNPIPRTVEGTILHHADSLDASVESLGKNYNSGLLKDLMK